MSVFNQLRTPLRRSIAAQTTTSTRQIFSWKQQQQPPAATEKQQPTQDGHRILKFPLAEEDLFHPLSESPFPHLIKRSKNIQAYAPCPVCLSQHDIRRHARYECPDCGYPSHCTEEHWKEDTEHKKYCSRLRESNEDEHDLRSGRHMREFDMPGAIPYEQTVSFANWDVFWYTAGFASIDTERQRRHASKLLTYPMTIAATLHQHSPLTLRNHRLTPEGARSLAALRTTLHVPLGAPDTTSSSINRPPIRIFILGARSESALPPHIWEQACLLFPASVFQVYFIGREISFPRSKPGRPESASTQSASPIKQESEVPTNTSNLPTAWSPTLQLGFKTEKNIIPSGSKYGVPSFYVPFSPQLSITGLKGNFSDVYPYFQGKFDPYTDVFFLFHPGFGFPSSSGDSDLQISSPADWGPVLPQLLDTKCAIFATGFSPVDMERDVRSLDGVEGVSGEFDWVVTPGPNPFGSEKWDVAEFDPRVMVKTNWGIWGIRGKRREIAETYFRL